MCRACTRPIWKTLSPDDARKLLIAIAPRLKCHSERRRREESLADHPEILRRLTTAQNDTVQVVDVIAYFCGYLPLALRLAGSFLAERPDFDAALYVRRLSENRLKQLGDVNSALQLSYDLLTPELHRSWRQLAVFPADFDRDAPKFVWEVDEDIAQDALSELVTVQSGRVQDPLLPPRSRPPVCRRAPEQ